MSEETKDPMAGMSPEQLRKVRDRASEHLARQDTPEAQQALRRDVACMSDHEYRQHCYKLYGYFPAA